MQTIIPYAIRLYSEKITGYTTRMLHMQRRRRATWFFVHFSLLLSFALFALSLALALAHFRTHEPYSLLFFLPPWWALSSTIMQFIERKSRESSFDRYADIYTRYGKLPRPSGHDKTLCGFCIFAGACYTYGMGFPSGKRKNRRK